MSEQPVRPHLSDSQLGMYARCPEAYRRRYLEGEKIPPGIAALVGSGFHGGVEANFRQKVATREDLPAKEIADMAVAAYDDRLAFGFVLSEEESLVGQDRVLGKGRDETARLAAVHASAQAPDYQPVMVEEKVRISLPVLTHDLLGIIDVADDQRRVVDFKTAGRKKSQADADSSLQLTIYAAAYQGITGHQASEVRLDTLVKLKRSPSRQVLTSTRGMADYNALAYRVEETLRAIASGAFPPTAPGNWNCSARWCGYWSTCRFVNHDRREAAEANDD